MIFKWPCGRTTYIKRMFWIGIGYETYDVLDEIYRAKTEQDVPKRMRVIYTVWTLGLLFWVFSWTTSRKRYEPKPCVPMNEQTIDELQKELAIGVELIASQKQQIENYQKLIEDHVAQSQKDWDRIQELESTVRLFRNRQPPS